MVTGTMLLLAIRQGNWQAADTMARELARRGDDGLLAAVAAGAKRCQGDDPRARALLSLWSELCWRSEQ